MNNENLITLQRCMIEVMEHPLTRRVIIETNIPNIGDSLGEQLYYMLDRSDDFGETLIDGTGWSITNSDGVGTLASCAADVLILFRNMGDGAITRIYSESF